MNQEDGRSPFLRAVEEIAPKEFETVDDYNNFVTGVVNFAATHNEIATDEDASALINTLHGIINARAPAFGAAFDRVSTAIVFGAKGSADAGTRLPYVDLLGKEAVRRLRSATVGLRAGTVSKYATLWSIDENEMLVFDWDRATNVLQQEVPFAAFRDTEALYRYRDGVYLDDGPQTAQEWIEARFVEHGMKAHTNPINEVVEALRRRTYTPRSEFQPKGKVCFSNGVLDLDSRRFSPHSPSLRFLAKFPVVYDEKADCPKFIKLVHEILPDEPDRLLVQEYFGSVLRLGNPRKYALLLIGPNDTGKSTLCSILGDIIGPEGVSSWTLQQLTDEKFAKAHLFGKYVNVAADLPKDAIRRPSMIKALTGNDRIQAEFKFQRAFQFVNLAKLIFSANEIPKAEDADLAFFRRWLLVQLHVQIAENRQIGHLAETLVTEEGPGILNWMIAGLHRLEARGSFQHAMSISDVARLWKQRSDPIGWFVEDRMINDYAAEVEKELLYQSYVAFCTDNKVRPADRSAFFWEFKRKTGARDTQKTVGKSGDHDVRLRYVVGWRLKGSAGTDQEGMGRDW